MTLQKATVKEFPAMTAEMIIAEMVRDWTRRTLPGDTAAADAAVAYALESFAGGASASEACEEARKMVLCRSRHPSAMPRVRLVAAS